MHEPKVWKAKLNRWNRMRIASTRMNLIIIIGIELSSEGRIISPMIFQVIARPIVANPRANILANERKSPRKPVASNNGSMTMGQCLILKRIRETTIPPSPMGKRILGISIIPNSLIIRITNEGMSNTRDRSA